MLKLPGRWGNLVEEIAAASQEQAQGIGQIGKAVTEMDKVVQQTAANAEESASASEEMSAQAQQMKVYVGDLVAVINGSGAAGRHRFPCSRSFGAVGRDRPAGPIVGAGPSGYGKSRGLLPEKSAHSHQDNPKAA